MLSQNAKSLTYEVINLVQLKLRKIIIETSNSQSAEEFRCLSIRTLYVGGGNRKTISSALQSKHKQNLNGIVCVISTQQEGYLYYFMDNGEMTMFFTRITSVCLLKLSSFISFSVSYWCSFVQDKHFESDGCISSYSFTAPIQKLILEDYFLHALTDAGLETYTMRVGHTLCKSMENVDGVNAVRTIMS